MKQINENFFEQPNALNSYWAGFLAADGCIVTIKQSLPNKDYKGVSLGLSQKDEEHIRQFAKDLGSDYKITKRDVNSFGKTYGVISTKIYNQKIVSDLENVFFIKSRKTHHLEFPSNLSDEHFLCYMAGYFDGDGSVHLSEPNKNGMQTLTMQYTCVAKEFNERVVAWFANKCNTTPKKITNKGFSLSGLEIVEIYNAVKRNNLPVLQRKWDKMKAYCERTIDKELEAQAKTQYVQEQYKLGRTIKDIADELGYSVMNTRTYLRGQRGRKQSRALSVDHKFGQPERFGEKNPNAKLTDEEAKQLFYDKTVCKMSNADIHKKYGVKNSQIYRIVRRYEGFIKNDENYVDTEEVA